MENQSKKSQFCGTQLAEWQKYGYDAFLDRCIDGKNRKLKLSIVEDGYGLDKMCDDPDPEIRAAVAAKGYVRPTEPDADTVYVCQEIIL